MTNGKKKSGHVMTKDRYIRHCQASSGKQASIPTMGKPHSSAPSSPTSLLLTGGRLRKNKSKSALLSTCTSRESLYAVVDPAATAAASNSGSPTADEHRNKKGIYELLFDAFVRHNRPNEADNSNNQTLSLSSALNIAALYSNGTVEEKLHFGYDLLSSVSPQEGDLTEEVDVGKSQSNECAVSLESITVVMRAIFDEFLDNELLVQQLPEHMRTPEACAQFVVDQLDKSQLLDQWKVQYDGTTSRGRATEARSHSRNQISRQ